MTSSISPEIRRKCRQSLRRDLRPKAGCDYGKQEPPKWQDDRLTTLAIQSIVDRDNMPSNLKKCLTYYSEGMGYREIGQIMGHTTSTVEVNIIKALDFLIDRIPYNLILNMPKTPTRYRINGCPHCKQEEFKGDLVWIPDEGLYTCLACSRQYDINNMPVAKEATA